MDTPYYFRDNNYQYKLQSHPNYGFGVGRSATAQALWSISDDYLEIVWFDLSGKFEGTEGIATTVYFQGEDSNDLELLFEKGTDFMKQKFGLRDEPISINRFWLPELDAGIEDLTASLKEFLADPDSFSEEEKNEYPELIKAWKDDNQYVFWWGQDFYLNEEGFVETS